MKEIEEPKTARVNPPPANILYSIIYCTLFVLLILVVIVGVSWTQFRATAPFLLYFLEICFVVCMAGSITGYFLRAYQKHKAELERFKHQTYQYLPDTIGNYAAYFDEGTHTFIHAEPGQPPPQPVPHSFTYSPHVSYRNDLLMRRLADSTQVEAAAGSEADGMIPTFHDLLRDGHIAATKPLIMGVQSTGELRTGSWLDLYTLAVAGIQGTGKSTSVLFFLLQAVLQGARLVLIDPHAETKPDSLARRLRGLPPTCYIGKIAITNQEILSRVRMVAAELKRRQRAGLSTPLILVVDEFTRLMRTKEIVEELGELLEAIAQEGRGYNIFALLTGQVWTATRTGGTELRYSIASSLIHRIQEAQAELLIPRKYAKYCPELKTGQALLYDTNGQSEILFMPFTTMTDVAEVAARLTGAPPGSPGYTDYLVQTTPLPSPGNENLSNGEQGEEYSEVDTEPLTIPPLSNQDIQVLHLLSEGKSQNQIMEALWLMNGSGSAYQQRLPEYRAILQRIAQHTRVRIEA